MIHPLAFNLDPGLTLPRLLSTLVNVRQMAFQRPQTKHAARGCRRVSRGPNRVSSSVVSHPVPCPTNAHQCPPRRSLYHLFMP